MTSFQNLHQATGREITVGKQNYLFFGGTAYLGLLNNPDYISLYQEGISIYGLNNGTSRSNNVQLGIYNEVESRLAERFGFADAAVFSSGYLAAQAVVRSLEGCREVLYAPGSHPALWLDGAPSVALDFKEWLIHTVDYINRSSLSSFMIVANSMDNLSPALFDFSGLALIASDKDVLLVLDDSHGIAIVRENNISTPLDKLKRCNNIDIVVVASMAKGLGTDAGLVLGSINHVMQVKSHPIFLGASPASPASMYALLHGDTLYKEAYDTLHSNMKYFSAQLGVGSGFCYVDGFPVYTSSSSSLYSYLSHCNILISSFPYPLPTSPLMNRIVVSALHHKSDLDYLLEKCLDKRK